MCCLPSDDHPPLVFRQMVNFQSFGNPVFVLSEICGLITVDELRTLSIGYQALLMLEKFVTGDLLLHLPTPSGSLNLCISTPTHVTESDVFLLTHCGAAHLGCFDILMFPLSRPFCCQTELPCCSAWLSYELNYI